MTWKPFVSPWDPQDIEDVIDRGSKIDYRRTMEHEEKKELTEKLNSLKQRLEPIERDILRMRRKGVTQGGIARLIGMSQPGVSHRLSRITTRLSMMREFPEFTTEEEIKKICLHDLHLSSINSIIIAEVIDARGYGLKNKDYTHKFHSNRSRFLGVLERLQNLRERGLTDDQGDRVIKGMEMVSEHGEVLQDSTSYWKEGDNGGGVDQRPHGQDKEEGKGQSEIDQEG